MLLPKIGPKALFAIAEYKLLPLTVKWLTKLYGHVRDEYEDAAVGDSVADISAESSDYFFALLRNIFTVLFCIVHCQLGDVKDGEKAEDDRVQ